MDLGVITLGFESQAQARVPTGLMTYCIGCSEDEVIDVLDLRTGQTHNVRSIIIHKFTSSSFCFHSVSC